MIVIAAASVLALVGVIHVTRVMKRGRNYKVVDQFWTMGPFTYFFLEIALQKVQVVCITQPVPAEKRIFSLKVILYIFSIYS